MKTFLIAKKDITYKQERLMRQLIREGLEKNNRPIHRGEVVAVKVNIATPATPDAAVCTHPIVLKTVVQELLAIGAHVKIVEDCKKNAVRVAGIQQIAEALGVQFLNLEGTKTTTVTVEDRCFDYYTELLEADHLVLLPKMKTHILTNYTGAIKLMYGGITKKQRTYHHKDTQRFAKTIVDIYSIRKPTLIVMDAILSMEGAGPTHGKAVKSNVLLVSNSGLAVDYYGSQIMGYDPLSIETNFVALNHPKTTINLDVIELIGDDLAPSLLKMKLVPVLKGKFKQRYLQLLIGTPKLVEEKCIRCGECISNCPQEAIEIERFPKVNLSKCIKCYCCMELCEFGAFTNNGKFK